MCRNSFHETNHRIFFDRLGQQLGLNSMDDWYNITNDDIQQHGGTDILKSYGNSTAVALLNMYPHHKWKLWKHKNISRQSLIQMPVQREFYDGLFKQLGYKSMDDWYKVTVEDIWK